MMALYRFGGDAKECKIIENHSNEHCMFTGSLEEMKKQFELVEIRQSEECGCPEEDWIIGMLYITIHLEPDTGGHIFIDCGDWEDEKLVDCSTMDELRSEAVKWSSSIPVNNEL
jgi:hypothetical protein